MKSHFRQICVHIYICVEPIKYVGFIFDNNMSQSNKYKKIIQVKTTYTMFLMPVLLAPFLPEYESDIRYLLFMYIRNEKNYITKSFKNWNNYNFQSSPLTSTYRKTRLIDDSIRRTHAYIRSRTTSLRITHDFISPVLIQVVCFPLVQQTLQGCKL